MVEPTIPVAQRIDQGLPATPNHSPRSGRYGRLPSGGESHSGTSLQDPSEYKFIGNEGDGKLTELLRKNGEVLGSRMSKDTGQVQSNTTLGKRDNSPGGAALGGENDGKVVGKEMVEQEAENAASISCGDKWRRLLAQAGVSDDRIDRISKRLATTAPWSISILVEQHDKKRPAIRRLQKELPDLSRQDIKGILVAVSKSDQATKNPVVNVPVQGTEDDLQRARSGSPRWLPRLTEELGKRKVDVEKHVDTEGTWNAMGTAEEVGERSAAAAQRQAHTATSR